MSWSGELEEGIMFTVVSRIGEGCNSHHGVESQSRARQISSWSRYLEDNLALESRSEYDLAVESRLEDDHAVDAKLANKITGIARKFTGK